MSASYDESESLTRLLRFIAQTLGKASHSTFPPDALATIKQLAQRVNSLNLHSGNVCFRGMDAHSFEELDKLLVVLRGAVIWLDKWTGRGAPPSRRTGRSSESEDSLKVMLSDIDGGLAKIERIFQTHTVAPARATATATASTPTPSAPSQPPEPSLPPSCPFSPTTRQTPGAGSRVLSAARQLLKEVSSLL